MLSNVFMYELYWACIFQVIVGSKKDLERGELPYEEIEAAVTNKQNYNIIYIYPSQSKSSHGKQIQTQPHQTKPWKIDFSKKPHYQTKPNWFFLYKANTIHSSWEPDPNLPSHRSPLTGSVATLSAALSNLLEWPGSSGNTQSSTKPNWNKSNNLSTGPCLPFLFQGVAVPSRSTRGVQEEC